MKRELIFLIGLSSAIYATQEISCVDFVNMQKVEAKSYLDNYRRTFELNHFKTKNHTETDKQYIALQGGVSKHLLNCINLRKVSYYSVEDVRRVLILSSLSKKVLSQEEESIYKNSLNKNIAYYSSYSNSSLFNVAYMPLVYLTIQRSKDKKYYIIYEFRKNGSEIKRYSKKILLSQPYIQFSNINAVSNQSYLSYINNNKIKPNLQVYKRQKYQRITIKHPKRVFSTVTIPKEEEYRVLNSFNAIKTSDNVTYDITNEFSLIKIKETKKRVYFLIGDEQYYASKKWWDKGTEKIGEAQ